MPELPEVETTRRGIEPHCLNREVTGMTVRQRQLRWPIPNDLASLVAGRRVQRVRRRGKYLLLDLENGSLLVHLGMSGSLRVLTGPEPVRTHDHVDLALSGGVVLRYNDPRRFGSILWQPMGEQHSLLASLGPEPLSADFDAAYLYRKSRGRKGPVKSFVMDSHIVVGVGNIYANEALFMAGIKPLRPAGKISSSRYALLADCIKQVLTYAIERGGTTLRDFVGGDGKPGYFAQELSVYGRTGLPCINCSRPLKEVRLGQRSTVYCVACQT